MWDLLASFRGRAAGARAIATVTLVRRERRRTTPASQLRSRRQSVAGRFLSCHCDRAALWALYDFLVADAIVRFGTDGTTDAIPVFNRGCPGGRRLA